MNFPSANDAHLRNTRKTKKMKKERVKVVYISTPLKVRTCASKFQALVQELTGKDSDIYELAELSNGNYLDCGGLSPLQSSRESPTSSNSFPDPPLFCNMDDILVTGISSIEESTFFGINFQQDLSSGICHHLLGYLYCNIEFLRSYLSLDMLYVQNMLLLCRYT